MARKANTYAPASPLSLSELLARSLEVRWHDVTFQLARSARHTSEESIHDLRVALRRLMAAIDMVLELRPTGDLTRARRELRRRLKSFNALRDTHVQILTLRRLTRRFPVLRIYRDGLLRSERRLVAAARRELPKVRLKRVEGPISGATRSLLTELSGPVADSVARTVVFGALGRAFARALERQRELSSADPLTIHRLRVAFKKCRYSTEILRPLIPGTTRRMLKAMNAYQTRMGEIQDLRVLASGVSAFALKRGTARGSCVPVQEYLARAQEERVRAFLATAGELSSFWQLPDSAERPWTST